MSAFLDASQNGWELNYNCFSLNKLQKFAWLFCPTTAFNHCVGSVQGCHLYLTNLAEIDSAAKVGEMIWRRRERGHG